MCDYVLGPWGEIKKEPFNSLEYKCEFCGGQEFYTPMFQGKKIWQCSRLDCAVMEVNKLPIATTTQAKSQRALEWPLFCEISGIGDSNHDVKFEDIRQSQGKIDYLKKFAEHPKGIIVMQGTKGTGKTFAALATCEMFTRKSTSAVFLTQKQLAENWLEAIKSSVMNNFIEKVRTRSLLVIDDFGTSEMTPAFLSFIMDLINTRMQWSNRGTIITTNLEDDTFTKYCGEALNDRFLTGQYFEFEGPSKRKKTVL
jgi:chromosomal replication initiation ATPase DnaA